MKTLKIQHRGTEINKIQFSEIESYLIDLGLNADVVFAQIADENEFVYVSNGFVSGLKKEAVEAGEWHHFFVKDGNSFEARKMQFTN